jgi:uncharacterized protein YjbI with pentapeptide repeats
MANDDHVAMLKQGVTAWNKWRGENRDILPDLTRAYLTEANLGDHLFRRDPVNLRKADLSRADLSGADLREAFLIEADLTRQRLGLALIVGAGWTTR